MTHTPPKGPVDAFAIPPRMARSVYPDPFAARVEGRVKRQLGEAFGLKNFGVNLTTLAPGAMTSLFHAHSRQDEFIYVVSGTPTLVLGDEEHILSAGMVVGFPAGGAAHHLRNDSAAEAAFLEVGDRTKGDEVIYPHDDLMAEMTPEGKWAFRHKDGTPY